MCNVPCDQLQVYTCVYIGKFVEKNYEANANNICFGFDHKRAILVLVQNTHQFDANCTKDEHVSGSFNNCFTTNQKFFLNKLKLEPIIVRTQLCMVNHYGLRARSAREEVDNNDNNKEAFFTTPQYIRASEIANIVCARKTRAYLKHLIS